MPSAVGCSVMSVSHGRSGAAAVNSRATRSSCTGGPALRAQAALLRVHRPDLLLASTAAATRFSPAVMPRAGSSSAMNRYPNAGSSRWMSSAALIRCASSQSRCGDRVCASRRRRPAWRSPAPGRSPRRGCRRRPGHGPAGSSFWGDLPGEDTPPPGAGSRSPAPAPGCVSSAPAAPPTPLLVTPGRIPSSTSASLSQRCRHDSEIPKSFAICDSGASPLRATATTSRRNSSGKRLRHDEHPSSEDQILTGQGVNRTGGSPRRRPHAASAVCSLENGRVKGSTSGFPPTP